MILKVIRVLGFLILCSKTLLAQERGDEELSEALFRARYNQTSNVRRNELIEQTEAMTVYRFKIPIGEVQNHNSKFLSAFEVETSGQSSEKFRIVYVPEDQDIVLKAYMEKYAGSLLTPLKGMRVQGKSSYYVYSPEGTAQQSFYLKTRIFRPESVSSRELLNSVIVGDLLESRAAPYVHHERTVTESPGHNEYHSYYNLIRSSMPSGVRSSEHLVLPLHSLLADPKVAVEKYPQLDNVVSDEWVDKTYMPMLSKLVTDHLFHYGELVEAHTQNLEAVFDKKSGDLIALSLKDLGAVSVDTYTKAITSHKGADTPYFTFYASNNRSNEPGYNVKNYAGQSVAWSGLSVAKAQEHYRKFLELFVKDAEKAMRGILKDPGFSLVLSPELLEELRNPHVSKRSLNSSTVEKLVDNIYQQFNLYRTVHLKKAASFNEEEQERLKSIYEKALQDAQVQLFQKYDHDGKNVRYYIAQEGVLAVDSITGAALGLAPDLAESASRNFSRPVERARLKALAAACD